MGKEQREMPESVIELLRSLDEVENYMMEVKEILSK
jgi:hypothetical protein